MAEAAEKRWTVEEFLAWDDGPDRRYELVDAASSAWRRRGRRTRRSS